MLKREGSRPVLLPPYSFSNLMAGRSDMFSSCLPTSLSLGSEWAPSFQPSASVPQHSSRSSDFYMLSFSFCNTEIFLTPFSSNFCYAIVMWILIFVVLLFCIAMGVITSDICNVYDEIEAVRFSIV